MGGKQLPPGGGTKLFLAGLLAVGGVALAVYAWTLRDDAVSDSARNAALIVGFGLGALCLLGTYGLLRQVFPPRLRHLHVTCAQEVRRGGHVDVQLEITKPSRVSERLELGLVCTEYYAQETTDAHGNSNRTTSNHTLHADWRPQPRDGGVRTVRFEVPRDAPYSYRGDCLSFIWRVSAREPKRLRFDPAYDVELTVKP